MPPVCQKILLKLSIINNSLLGRCQDFVSQTLGYKMKIEIVTKTKKFVKNFIARMGPRDESTGSAASIT